MQIYDTGAAAGKPAASSASSEGSGYNADEKKRRRMESNRESARRSRQKKQKHLDDLLRDVGNIQRENDEFEKRIGHFSGKFSGVDSENRILRDEKEKLVRRLESLESVIEIAKVVRGGSDDGDGSDDPMMKPWMLPYPTSMPAVFASSSSGSLRRSNFYS